MKKHIVCSLFLTTLLIVGVMNNMTEANSSDVPPPFEEAFPEVGYKSVEEALKEFEQHFGKELKLPLRVPPISFTHKFGRFSNSDGEMNDSFEMKLISDQMPRNHFKIDVRPLEYKIPFDKYVTKVYMLDNGQEASFVEYSRVGFNMLVFERDGWQYVFSIDQEVADQVTAEVLVRIANSIDYPQEKEL
ncbi:hypothetical protein [Ureibacillus acetophenoni]|uniref:Uncharacterized protein n=1 Tax=Ureibacillus acetophenoni TaxID=614649 RepID=A0A285UQD1_9BACL|nr:hypothetical protein [Ureibacillus acetophenoni]SOC43897.1 hypothetical protein SAMN05877842_11794 [Ureibacillus acetophenoni]